MRIHTLRLRLRDLGAKPIHEQRVLRLWSQALPQDSGRRQLQDFLPQEVRAALPDIVAELERYAARSGHRHLSRRPELVGLLRRWRNLPGYHERVHRGPDDHLRRVHAA